VRVQEPVGQHGFQPASASKAIQVTVTKIFSAIQRGIPGRLGGFHNDKSRACNQYPRNLLAWYDPKRTDVS
jgi:hypothetical protein